MIERKKVNCIGKNDVIETGEVFAIIPKKKTCAIIKIIQKFHKPTIL